MLLIYDKEDCDSTDPSRESPPFLQRLIVHMTYVRTDCFDKTMMQNWVKTKDGVPTKDGKNWVYNHYVPHSRIYKAIEDVIMTNSMTRETAIQWLVDIALKLKIKPDATLVATKWKANRVAYDLWADWAISAICDWKENIFYGPGTGDVRGSALDNPTNGKQLKRVTRAAAKLQRLIQAKQSLLTEVISAEELVGNEETDPFVRNAQADKENKKMWLRFFKTGKLLDEDVADENYEEEEESDEEEKLDNETREWRRKEGLGLRPKNDFKKGFGVPQDQGSKAPKADKKDNKTGQNRQGFSKM